MSTIPIFLTAEKHHVLIVGTGDEARAKLALMSETDAAITVVGPGVRDALAEAGLTPDGLGHDRLHLVDRPFHADDLSGKTLVYIATGDDLSEERIRRQAQERGLPVNVVDKPAKSNFITPAQFRRGPLRVAFSSGGVAPVFVRRLRALLERIVPRSLGVLAEAAGDVRGDVKRLIPDGTRRRLFWDSLFDRAGDHDGLTPRQARDAILEAARAHGRAGSDGIVQLVGAGPGDPELITLKAHRALQQADVVVYDRLVSRDVLSLARRDAELLYAGKREGEHGIGQHGINQLMLDHAHAGKRVVRLKGGDPLTFSRAGEELAALRGRGVSVEIIPGITALAGIAASSQIPLTDRDHASSVTLATGRLKDGSMREWADLAGEGRTLAVYMGVRSANAIADGLIRHGVPAATPVAVVENGTRANERRLYGQLDGLGALVAREAVQSPALLIIGDVVQVARDWPGLDHLVRDAALAATG
ncbi:siroheme synthase CysG [Yunchengibacter salinarum]|uniref:siroheme synthase CysG n=1 Tax=Yunchengibacter salinarum TaxID=3133399 RepID=UPI0035B60553